MTLTRIYDELVRNYWTLLDLTAISEDPFDQTKLGRFMVKMQLLLQIPPENVEFLGYLRFIYVKLAILIVN